jgi:hypothetical protein
MSVILFPSQPFSPREIDGDFAAEQLAAQQAGLATALVDHTRIVEGAAAAGVARVSEGAQVAVYRGWMLKPHQYEAMRGRLRAHQVSRRVLRRSSADRERLRQITETLSYRTDIGVT